MDVWAEGADWRALETRLRAARPRRAAWLQDARPMRVLVDSWLRKLPLAEQVAWIERLDFLGFQVRLAHIGYPMPYAWKLPLAEQVAWIARLDSWAIRCGASVG